MINVPAKRIESDVHLRLSLKDNGVAIAWDSLKIEQICMYSVEQKAFAGQCDYVIDPKDNHLLNVTYPAGEQLYLGDHRIVARVILEKNEATYDALAFTFKPYTDSDGAVEIGPVEVGIEVKEVDTTIMKEILSACQAATDEALKVNAAISEAERLRVEAETARAKAETARAEAERLRVEAESARVEAEASRVEAETARAKAEASRAQAEELRFSAEKNRAKAEDLRKSAESARVKAEDERVNAENARAREENARATAETARAKAETARAEAERLRVEAETARVIAETARAKAEDLRVSAENARASAENKREADTKAAISDMKITVSALTAGLFTLDVEDGELVAITNTEGSTLSSVGMTDNGEPYLEFNV